MPKPYIPKRLKAEIERLAGGRCEYCKSLEKYRSSTYESDHVEPFAQGGKTVLENLARACRACNNGKHNKTHAHDSLTHQLVPLFHPRKQKWSNHFEWSDDTLYILGKTPTGRASVIAIDLNREAVVNLRILTLAFGEHPPKED